MQFNKDTASDAADTVATKKAVISTPIPRLSFTDEDLILMFYTLLFRYVALSRLNEGDLPRRFGDRRGPALFTGDRKGSLKGQTA
jgi:hypothetical protein